MKDLSKKITVRKDGTVDVETVNTEPTKTRVELQDQCDVNLIIKKYQETGELSHINNRQNGVYADLSNMPDYQQSLDMIITAETAFMDLPSSLRERFENDPAKLVKFMSDERNFEEAIKLGLVNKKDITLNQAPNDEQKTKNKTTTEPKKAAKISETTKSETRLDEQ